MAKRLKIATYSICLNEEKHIERYLTATKDSDIRVVLDTGSTDRSLELLKKAKNVIVAETKIIPWRFEEARNQALALVPEDVDICVTLDMDEIPEKGFYKKLRWQWRRGSGRGWLWMDTGFKWKMGRVHSRHGWKWKWPIHEEIIWQGEGEPTFCDLGLTIKHEPDKTKSRAQYLTMLIAAHEEMPDDSRMATYLCREYYFHDKWQEVIDTAKKALSFGGWATELAAICRWAGDAAKNIGQDSTYWFDEGAKLCPDEGEAWLGVAADALRHKDWAKALDASIRLLEAPMVDHYLHEPSAWKWKGFDIAARAAFELGQLDEAIIFAQEAIKGNGSETKRIKRNLTFMEELRAQSQAKSG